MGNLDSMSISNGFFTAANGGGITFNYTKTTNDPIWSLALTANGGDGMNGGGSAGSVYNVDFTAGNGGKLTVNGVSSQTLTMLANGGNAADGNSSNTVYANSTFTAGHGGTIGRMYSGVSRIEASGGVGYRSTGKALIVDTSSFYGGNGSEIETYTSSTNTASRLTATGGDAFTGAGRIITGTFVGGEGGRVIHRGPLGADVYVTGGSGFVASGDSSIEKGFFRGGHAGSGSSPNGTVHALGGDAVGMSGGTLIIHDGDFEGGNGGQTDGVTAFSRGGHGAFLRNGKLTVKGGQFTGGFTSGTRDRTAGIASENSDVTIDGEKVIVYGGMIFNGTTVSGKTNALELMQGRVAGDIEVILGTTTPMNLTWSDSMVVDGNYAQNGGRVNMKLSSSENAGVFKNAYINSGTLNFQNVMANISGNISLGGTGSVLSFEQGARMAGGSINAGTHRINVTSGDFLMDSGRVNLSVATTFNTNGVSSLDSGYISVASGGALVLSNKNAKIVATGVAAKPSGEITLSTGTITANGPLADYVDVDLGWLVDTTLADNGGIKATLSLRPLTDSLPGIHAGVLAGVQSNLTSSRFLKRTSTP
jgi:hypothetical protein